MPRPSVSFFLSAALLVVAGCSSNDRNEPGSFPVTSTGGEQASGGNPGGMNSGGNSVVGPGGTTAYNGGTASASGGTDASNGGASNTGGATAILPPPDLTHSFDPIPIAANHEIPDICQSWTLNNDQPLFVNVVHETNKGFFHHSNWIWVPDTQYPGPDGTWTCADRGFDQILAGAVGGVFFAQSTQAKEDNQAFPPGVAFQVPAHARIIGDVHLLNLTDTDATSNLSFDVYTLPEPDVTVQLHPMAFTNLSLDIAPKMTTHAHMQCATPQPDFDIYYILPHYHAMGTGMEITVAGGAMNNQQIFQALGGFGQSVGQVFDPPISIKGATGLGITCDYDSQRTQTVKYGEADQEMCVALIYSTGIKAGGETFGAASVTNTGNTHDTDSICIAVGAP